MSPLYKLGTLNVNVNNIDLQRKNRQQMALKNSKHDKIQKITQN